MRQFSLLLLGFVPICGSGCSFAQNIRQNVVFSPMYAATEAVDHHRHLQMGREAFAEMAMAYPDYEYSCDYRRGFVDGFADYLDFGGIGEAPPVPPPSYRSARYETPEGLAMMEDWTIGFRHGACTAKASGLRGLGVIPVYKGPTYGAPYIETPMAQRTRPSTGESEETKPPPPPVPLPGPQVLPIEPKPVVPANPPVVEPPPQ
ncbi:MAG: hypothetical protein ACJ8C4_03825 [Gemmataceae bacterium]